MPATVPPGVTTAQLARELESTRRRLYRIARAADPKALSKRPPSGDWSPLEHVRHLLFAEQLHFGRLQKGKTDFSPLGMTGMRAKIFTVVGTAKSPKLEEVLTAWDKCRATNRRALKGRDDEPLRKALYGNASHIRIHTRTIEQLLQG